MAHRQPRFHRGDDVYDSHGIMRGVLDAMETPLGWQYRLTPHGSPWTPEHALRTPLLQWRQGLDGVRDTSGRWTIIGGAQLWYGSHLIGSYERPALVAEATETTWARGRL